MCACATAEFSSSVGQTIHRCPIQEAENDLMSCSGNDAITLATSFFLSCVSRANSHLLRFGFYCTRTRMRSIAPKACLMVISYPVPDGCICAIFRCYRFEWEGRNGIRRQWVRLAGGRPFVKRSRLNIFGRFVTAGQITLPYLCLHNENYGPPH